VANLSLSLSGIDNLQRFLNPDLHLRAAKGGIAYASRSVPPAVSQGIRKSYYLTASRIKQDISGVRFTEQGTTATISFARRPPTLSSTVHALAPALLASVASVVVVAGPHPPSPVVPSPLPSSALKGVNLSPVHSLPPATTVTPLSSAALPPNPTSSTPSTAHPSAQSSFAALQSQINSNRMSKHESMNNSFVVFNVSWIQPHEATAAAAEIHCAATDLRQRVPLGGL